MAIHSSEKQVNIGVVGVGRHGSRYARHIAKGDATKARLVAVNRRDEKEGRALAKELDCRYYARVEELVADPEVDAVVITTPTKYHLEHARAAAQAGKHILCEKPMARTTDECRRMAYEAERAGVKLAVGQTLRYTPLLVALRDRLNELGELYGLHACMRQERAIHPWHQNREVAGGGALIEIGVHLFDAIRYLTGRNIVRVMGEMRDVFGDGVESCASGLLWLEGGATSTFDVAKCTEGRLTRFEAVGAEGGFLCNLTANTLHRVQGREVSRCDAPGPGPTIPVLIADFCNAILHDTAVPISAEDGLHTIAVCEALYRAAGTDVPQEVRA